VNLIAPCSNPAIDEFQIGGRAMRLLLKFNLIFLLVFVAGVIGAGKVSYDLLQSNAKQEVLDHARLTMEKAAAVRAYTNDQIRPLLETQMKYTFLPQTVPAYSATEVLATLAKTFPDYTYKEATLNPTNPRDRAVDWEADIVNRFRAPGNQQTEFVGERESGTGRTLYIARPLRIVSAACLVCHSTVEAAPRTLIDKYGPANGFGWQMNEVIGAQVVSVPMSVPLARADRAFRVFMTSLIGIFVAIGIALNVMLYLLVIRPVTQLSKLADRVSLGELDAPPFATRGRDEIGRLSQAFERMRNSLAQAMKMLDA
jgi:protein-histidine pros-kinase